jgi:transcriptional regulator with XRE-family HTH domain
MVHRGDRLCPRCGAYLRRTRDELGECDPCRRVAPALALDPAVWEEPGLSVALAQLDFGPVFLRVRAEASCSQQRLGELLDLDQSSLSKIERGQRSLTDAASVVRVANVLGIPAGKLGFRYGVTGTVGDEARSGWKGSWVERRDFVEKVAGLTFGAVGVDIHRLLSLFPQAEPTGTRHVGAADVAAIEQATTTYARQDFAEGSGMVRDLAVTHLGSVLPLLDAQVPDEVRPRLYLATAELALIAGYMSFDVNQHDAARRLWMIGLDLTRNAEDPHGSDLTVYLLYDMAAQAVHLGCPDEALKLVHLGQAAAVGAHPVSAATASCLTNIQARAHAARSDAPACDRALGQAEDYFAAIDPDSTPLWVAHIGDAYLSIYQGVAYHSLAIAGRDPGAANRAVTLLHHAVNHLGTAHARGRALYLPDLAGAHAIAGDIGTAVTVGHQAVDAVTAVHSPRAYGRLQVLHTVLGPLRASPGVGELRERLATTAC